VYLGGSDRENFRPIWGTPEGWSKEANPKNWVSDVSVSYERMQEIPGTSHRLLLRGQFTFYSPGKADAEGGLLSSPAPKDETKRLKLSPWDWPSSLGVTPGRKGRSPPGGNSIAAEGFASGQSWGGGGFSRPKVRTFLIQIRVEEKTWGGGEGTSSKKPRSLAG